MLQGRMSVIPGGGPQPTPRLLNEQREPDQDSPQLSELQDNHTEHPDADPDTKKPKTH